MNHLPSPQADGHPDVLPSGDTLASTITNTVVLARAFGLDFPELISVIWDGWEAYEQALVERPQTPVDRITG